VVTEKVFSWPGIGTLLLNAIQNMDFPLVQGCILMIAGVYVVTNLLVDVLYAVVDPRVKP
jgi:peptide/nickel transport system permease protein